MVSVNNRHNMATLVLKTNCLANAMRERKKKITTHVHERGRRKIDVGGAVGWRRGTHTHLYSG